MKREAVVEGRPPALAAADEDREALAELLAELLVAAVEREMAGEASA